MEVGLDIWRQKINAFKTSFFGLILSIITDPNGRWRRRWTLRDRKWGVSTIRAPCDRNHRDNYPESSHDKKKREWSNKCKKGENNISTSIHYIPNEIDWTIFFQYLHNECVEHARDRNEREDQEAKNLWMLTCGLTVSKLYNYYHSWIKEIGVLGRKTVITLWWTSNP